MRHSKRRSIAILGLLLCASTSVLHAQTNSTPAANTPGYPAKPIRVVVGYPPGASTDSIARYVADILSKSLKNPVVVENRPGAGGNIAAEMVRNAPADGHTLLLAIASHVSNRGLYKSLPYEPIKDFAPVNLVARLPFILVANQSFPGNSMSDVIAMAKSNPKGLDYASSGIGSSQHLAIEQLNSVAGIKLNHVAYRGGAPALMAVASGEVPLAFLSTTVVQPLIQKGTIKPIAIASPKRSVLLPNAPTFAESGVPNYTADTWYGVLAPAGTPAAIVNRLNAEISRSINTKEAADKFATLDAYVINAGPEEFLKIMRDDEAKWLKIVRDAKIQAE